MSNAPESIVKQVRATRNVTLTTINKVLRNHLRLDTKAAKSRYFVELNATVDGIKKTYRDAAMANLATITGDQLEAAISASAAKNADKEMKAELKAARENNRAELADELVMIQNNNAKLRVQLMTDFYAGLFDGVSDSETDEDVASAEQASNTNDAHTA